MVSIRLLGTCCALPENEPNQDCTCALVDDNILIDTGFCASVNMLRHGVTPCNLDYLFITHCHHDHYMGLPQILFYQTMANRRKTKDSPFTIVGVQPEIHMIVERTSKFLRADHYNFLHNSDFNIVDLTPGESFDTPRYHVTTCPTIHTVPGLCYRFTEKETGKSFVCCWDTAQYEGLIRHAKDADLLLHEASYGPNHRDPILVGGHSGAPDAAELAKNAHVGQLALVHYYPRLREANLQSARAIFPNTIAPLPGDLLTL
ncbi:MAG: MBL fold metallo-hydrolase [Victivallales bacterium]|nr:MBL fold metallo-hydrolase [Victivallales bacterium]